MRPAIPIIVGSLLLVTSTGTPAQTLKGSRVAMLRQNEVARALDFTFLKSGEQVHRFVSLGLLVAMPGSGDYELDGVSFPYGRPALKTFITRLAGQYRRACGEQLVLTSLTRPLSEQPNNASDLSVHPTGMAVDLRVSRRGTCARWLSKTLLSLEKNGVLDATLERRPPHYHVALFPQAYTRYVKRIAGAGAAREASPVPARLAAAAAGPAEPAAAAASAAAERYEVNRGDSLWTIARRYNTTVAAIRQLNNLRGSRIAAGQVITVPVADGPPNP
jgi:LysM repeat protein